MNINYIGSKKSLLEEIEFVFKQNCKLSSNLVFGDLFSGTGVVGEHFNQKFGMQIISNDSEYYSFILNYAQLKCPYNDQLHRIFKSWNRWSNKISKYGLFSLNYAYHNKEERENRKFFLLENAQKIDGIRLLIERYYQKQKITQSEYFFLLASLIVSADKVANITSVYGAYLKNFKLTARKNFQFIPIHCHLQIPKAEKNQIFQKNSLEIDSLNYDICYLDPPYNNRQYSKNYAPLNFLAIYKNELNVYGKTGLIRDSFISSFCRKKTVFESFTFLLDRIKSRYILISYNSEGLLTLSQLRTLFEKYGSVKIYEFPYKRYQSQRKSRTCKIREYLFLIQCKKSITNESLGISLEQNLCLLNKMNYPQSLNYRSWNFYNSDLKEILHKFLEDHPQIQFQKYIGSKPNLADFLLTDGSTLSVKSNKSPSKIGQLTKKRFCEEFHLPKNVDFKSFILKNVFKLTFQYYQNLWNCDYILWVYKQKNKFCYLLINRKNAFPYPFNKKKEFSFTRGIENWKESTTLKYKKVSIGEYPIHKNRDCIKFRFHFKNVLNFLKVDTL
uniref:site-specific DNA-methyltransferase (adenine-specific) n=1 Tax=Rhipilia penicilloides TaxID=1979422 RepID=A0A2P0QIZ0_9CHLO|nr:hypothetical protein [Rhipilia penicilloides]ARO74249.1 hypothetical protein [Rhipilia penicilloides]